MKKAYKKITSLFAKKKNLSVWLDSVRQLSINGFKKIKSVKIKDIKKAFTKDSLADFFRLVYETETKQKVIFSLVIVFVAALFSLIRYNQRTMVPDAVFRRSVLSSWDYVSDDNATGMKASLKKEKTALSVLVERDNSQIEFKLPIDNPSLKVNENAAVYTNADKNIEVKYELQPNKLKESIILNSPTNKFEFTSSFLVQNLIAKMNDEKTPVFFDTNDNYQFHLEKPYAIDAAGKTTFDVTYTLQPKTTTVNQNPFTQKQPIPKNLLELETLKDIKVNTNEYELLVSVDPDWLMSAERQYPIIIDPTITHDTSSEFAVGTFNRVSDTGSGTAPVLESYYQEINSDEDTIGLYHMNEPSVFNSCPGGTTDMCDVSGNSNDGYSYGVTLTYNSFLGYAARDFDGSGYIYTNDLVGFGTGNTPHTVEAWVKPNAIPATRQWPLLLGGASAGNLHWLWNTSGTFALGRWGGGSCLIYPTVGEWNHLASSYDGQTLSCYLNGELVQKLIPPSTFNFSALTLKLGQAQLSEANFDGSIDELKISNRARSSEEIKADAQRRPYSIYTSPVIDLGTNENDWSAFQKLSWEESGGQTGDGETPSDSTGLIAQWNFNETSGATIFNSAGSCGTSCDATLYGFTGGMISQDASPQSGWTTNSKWGAGALKFDGSSDYAVTNGSINLAPTTSSPFTIEIWVNPEIFTSNQAFIQSEDGTGTGRTLLGINSTITNFYSNIGGTMINSTIPHEPNKWYHVAVVYSGSGETLYINGQAEATGSNIIEVNSAPFIFGAFKAYASGFYNGIIDSAKIYSRELTAAEIKDNYNATNIQFQTRAGTDATPDDGSWEEWKPANESLLENFDSEVLPNKIYQTSFGSPFKNQLWYKKDNSIPSASDTTSTNGRVPLGTAGKGDDAHVYAPTVIKDGSTYKMWYKGSNGNYRIYYATSSDGLAWTKYDNTVPSSSDTTGTNGRIPLGTADKGDDAHVGYPNVIKDGSTYKMWYSGHDGINWRIFYATSPDGLTWTKYDNSIESPSDNTGTNGRIPFGLPGSGDSAGALRPSVIKDGDIYKMWYSGLNDAGNWRIFYATSPDGLTWTKYNNGVLPASNVGGINGQIPLGEAGSADSSHAYEPMVIKDGDIYKMWYNAHNGNVTVAYATSLDGLTWKKLYNAVPTTSDTNGGGAGRLPRGVTGGDVTHSYSPTVIKDGSTYKMWYSGYNSGWKIYHAFMNPLPASTTFDSNIKIEGTDSQKINAGILQADDYTVGLWRLNETSGTGAYIKDLSGNGHNGTPTGHTVVNGIEKKAMDFDGSTSVITVPASTDLDLTGNYTLEAWVNPGSIPASTSGIMGKYSANGWGLNITNTGLPNFGSHSCSNFSGTTVVQPGQWYYVVGVYQESGDEYVYVNGELEATGSLTDGNCANDTSSVVIGQFRTGILFDGIIDEVRISNVARPASEIAENYRMGQNHYINYDIGAAQDLSNKSTLPFYIAGDRPGTYLSAIIGKSAFANYQADKNTIGLWHLDERVGSGSFLLDASGSGISGTPTGTSSTEGVIGKARSFSGTGEYITIGNLEELRIIEDQTIDMWLYPTDMTIRRNPWAKAYGGEGTITQEINGTLNYYWGEGGGNASPYESINSATAIPTYQWSHIAIVRDLENKKVRWYINGVLTNEGDTTYNASVSTLPAYIGTGYTNVYAGMIDEVRISNVARSAEEIRQAHDIGKRSHSVTIDFGASLDSGNLITGSGDTSFTVDATSYGLSNKGSNLYKGDKIIVRENYDGTEYIAQGTVDSINESTGATTVSSWDTGGTFPTGGFTINADVFKWQREFFDISGSMRDDRNAATTLSFRLSDGNEGRTIWLDDAKAATDYLTTPLSSAIVSTTGNRYVQYRTIFTATDTLISGSISEVSAGGFDGSSTSTGNCYLEESRNDDQITIHWDDNATDEIGFEIEKRINGTIWNTVDRTSANITSYNDENIASGNTYQYRVRKLAGDGGTGEWCSTSVVDLGEGSFQMEGLQIEGIRLD